MATWFLCNNIQVGTDRLIAGSLIDDAQEDATAIRNAGGLLVDSANAPVAAAAALAQAAKLRGDDPAACAAIMMAGLETSQEQEVTTPVTNATALAAITAANRTNGMEAVKLDDYTTWVFASGSAEAASDWCIVPAAGTGRWLRSDQTRGVVRTAVANAAALVALTAINRKDGTLVVKLDDMTVWSYDLGSVLTTDDWHIEPTDGVGCWFRMDVADGRVLPPVANNAALIALTATDRQDGSIVVQLDTMQTWTYDLGSAAAASSWCVLPTDAVGRWLRFDNTTGVIHPVAANRAAVRAIPATDRVNGMALVKEDDLTLWGFSAASADAASSTVIDPAAGTGRWHRSHIYQGIPMQNRLRMLGAPGVIATGNTIVIGADTYEIRPDTPPTGGTAGRIWVYTGIDSHAARVNLADAINAVVDAARIAYPAAGVVEDFLAEHDNAAVGVGHVTIVSADAAGGLPIPSAVATACAETLATGTDIWDNAACRYGQLRGTRPHILQRVTILAADIAKATFQLHFDFTPTIVRYENTTTPLNREAIAINGNAVSLTLAGGGPTNVQANDVLIIEVLG